MPATLRNAALKVLPPLLISLGIFAVFYFGGDAYQAFGLAAVDSTRNALKHILGVAAFLSLAVLAQRVIHNVVFDGLVATATGAPVPKLLRQISGLLIFAVAISACAGIVFEQDLTVLWAASGVAGLVLGMALRELLQDVFAGIALNIDRAVRIGEHILLHKAGDSTVAGQVLEISWRTTRIKDLSGDVVILPNSRFSSCTITNYSQPEPVSWRAASVTLDARVPPARAIRILQAAALDGMLEAAGPEAATPCVEVKAIRLEGVDYAICFKAPFRHLANAKPAILRQVLEHLAQAGLAPARPPGEAADTPGATALAAPDAGRLIVLLGGVPVFAGLDLPDLALLAAGARLRAEPAGRVVVQAGEAGEALHVVVEGLLAAEPARRGTARPGPALLLRPGDALDPAAALLGEAHAASVRARTPVLLCELDQDVLRRLFAGSATALACIAGNLVRLQPVRSLGPTAAQDIPRQLRHMFPETWPPAAE